MKVRYTVPQARDRLKLLRGVIAGVNAANAQHECPEYDQFLSEASQLTAALELYDAGKGATHHA